MPRRLLLAILMLIAAPMVILGWLSVRSLKSEEVIAKQRLISVFEQQLITQQLPLKELLEGYKQRLAAEVAGLEGEDLLNIVRKLERDDPVVKGCVLVTANGPVAHPSQPLSDDPKDLNRYAALVALAANRPTFLRNEKGTMSSSRRQSSALEMTPSALANESIDPVWQTWFRDQGMQLVLWFPQMDGDALGIVLERSRWIADVIGALPTTPSIDSSLSKNVPLSPGYSEIVDEQQKAIYRWGNRGDGDLPLIAEASAGVPLSNWALHYHGDVTQLLPNQASTVVLWSVIATSAVFVAIGAYVVTSMQRQMKLASDQVSFAGQVSHELRTPLTNIRLYVDLAKSDLADSESEALTSIVTPRLEVISQECERLTDLVSGVLDFVRGDQAAKRLRLRAGIADEWIDKILEPFIPGFAASGIKVERIREASQSIVLDEDILRIVLVNLLGNVDKYAASGKYVLIRSSIENNKLMVRVRDHGPGIPIRYRRHIFKPFTRLNHAIEAPSGTGIGLSIAQSAAKRHGGSLVLEPCAPPGACFLLSLPLDRDVQAIRVKTMKGASS